MVVQCPDWGALAGDEANGEHTPFLSFERSAWSKLRASTPLTLTEADLVRLQGINEDVSLQEVADIYLPLSRLLNLHVIATQGLHRVTDRFLGNVSGTVPYVIGIAGSVAAGKSTTARILRELLSRWPDHPKVDLVTTDGFLHSNAVLEERGLMKRKGFPESYDRRRLLKFVSDLKSGVPRVEAPVYSHMIYDIVPGAVKVVEQPDVVLIEGLNVLQSGDDYRSGGGRAQRRPRTFVSDFFDFSIYVDAAPRLLEQWYVHRFLKLRLTAFRDPNSYFKRYGEMSADEAHQEAGRIWQEINAINLEENIAPTSERARLVLQKGEDHAVRRVLLRKI
ncbi:MAG: type I pantothenate kinase [Myxococcota bacterium]